MKGRSYCASLTWDATRPLLASRIVSSSPIGQSTFGVNVDFDVSDALRRLKAEGIVQVRTINHGPTVSMYYKDPDGNQVELQVDAFDKAGAASYFHSEPFAKNPIGVLFDADRMAADYEAGVPEAELLRRP